MRLIKSVEEIRTFVNEARGRGRSIGLVPTMGALHDGHLGLIRQAKQQCDISIVSIFLNPTQFDPEEDFASYPRDLNRDLGLLNSYNVDAAFTPTAEQMYPQEFQTSVIPGPLSKPWEGQLRPSHFRGVTTVVLKLFNMVRPDVAYFGQKDFQQFIVVRRMVEDFNLTVRLVVCPIRRDADGLALSSRNAYLSPSQRKTALALSRGLRCGEERVRQGESRARVILDQMRQGMEAEPGFELDYLAIVDPKTLASVEYISAGCIALAAGRVDQVHLIDNTIFGPPGAGPDELLQMALAGPAVASGEARIPGIETETLKLRIEHCRECAALSSVHLPPREFLVKYIKRDYPDLNAVRIAVIGRCSSIRPDNYPYRNQGRESRFVNRLLELLGVESFIDFKKRFVLTDALRCHYSGPHIPEKAMRNCVQHLRAELELFPNLETLVVIGDDAYFAVRRFVLGRGPADVRPFLEFLGPPGWAEERAKVSFLDERELHIFYCHHPTFGYMRSPSLASVLHG
jgi:pantoate--beta-alanine ligase